MATARPEGAGIGLHDYRRRVAERLQEAGIVDADGVDLVDLIFNLTRLSNRLSLDFEGVHRPRGWTLAGFRIMNVLWVVGRLELRELARLAGASRAAVSAVLNTLERDGLVSRTRDADDGRLVHVGLTERGQQELLDAMPEQAVREQRWFAVLDSRQQRRLSELLAAVADQPTPPV